MKRSVLAALISFIFGFSFFLLLAPINQSLAVGSGGNCSYGSRPGASVACDAGLTCDTNDDDSAECDVGKICRGKCFKECRVSVGSTTPNGGCSNTEYCESTSDCTGGGCHYGYDGYCKSNSAPHVAEGGFCTSSSTYGGAAAAQGNCLSGLVCNVAANKSCSPAGGGCQGQCFPADYSCKANIDSRAGARQFECPINFSCVENQNKKPNQACVDPYGNFQVPYTDPFTHQLACPPGSSFSSTIQQCPGCIWSCAPEVDVRINCKCQNRPDNGGNIGSGKNGFICKNAITTAPVSYCADPTIGCYDDNANAIMTKSDVFAGEPLHGIQCLRAEQKHPPAPPCQKYEFPNGTSTDKDNHGKCLSIATSFGEVGTDPGAFITRLFGILLGVSGAIALLLIMRAGYRIMTSRGNPEGIQQGREQLVAAIVGLLFLIFSFVLLQVIGVDLLQLPHN